MPDEKPKKFWILQNMKPVKSLARVYVNMIRYGQDSEQFLSARTSFFRNFSFYNWNQLEKLWNDFCLPSWKDNLSVYRVLRDTGINQRVKEPPIETFPIEYWDNEFSV
jgi:hypothetical protein